MTVVEVIDNSPDPGVIVVTEPPASAVVQVISGGSSSGSDGDAQNVFIAALPVGQDIDSWDPAPDGFGEYVWFVLDADGDVIDIRKGVA